MSQAEVFVYKQGGRFIPPENAMRGAPSWAWPATLRSISVLWYRLIFYNSHLPGDVIDYIELRIHAHVYEIKYPSGQELKIKLFIGKLKIYVWLWAVLLASHLHPNLSELINHHHLIITYLEMSL